MRSLKHSLAEYSPLILEGIAQNLGIRVIGLSPEDAAASIAGHLLDAQELRRVLDALSPQALDALARVQRVAYPFPWASFVRRFGPVRELGPEALRRERPWRRPQSPAEELLYHGLIFRALRKVHGTLIEVVYIPPELQLLLPPVDETLPLPEPVSAPESVRRTWNTFLNDLVVLIAHIFNEGLQVDWEGRPLRGALAQVGQKFHVPLSPTELLHPPPRVSLLFHHARALGHVHQEGGELRIRARSLNRWLKASPAYQRLTLWRAWVESPRWLDVCHVPSLECVQGDWDRHPRGVRERFLSYWRSLKPDVWYPIDAWVQFMREWDPDFLRWHGHYDTWLIRRPGEEGMLRGVEHWDAVEGALIRFYITGPLFWLDAVYLSPDGTRFALSEAGYRWLRRRSEPRPSGHPPLRVTEDFRVHLPLNAWAGDHFRVTRFTTWERSTPHYVYRISKEGLNRAHAQGIPVQKILSFLQQASHGHLPPSVEQALRRWRPEENRAGGTHS